MTTIPYARWFRDSTPYISAHRGKTFVVLLSGEALAHNNMINVVHDLALLHVLGVRLLIVHGARLQLNQSITDSSYHAARRITDHGAMAELKRICGTVRSELEALFSTGLPNTPMHNVDIQVLSGNFVTAQPVGILDGVDHLFTGTVRQVDSSRIRAALASNNLVLQAPIGYSPSGQAYNLAADELAAQLAISLQADKLVVLDEQAFLSNDAGQRISTLTPITLAQHLESLESGIAVRLNSLGRAVSGGVRKAHLVSFAEDGALLGELFTAQGVGTQIVEQPAQTLRRAVLDDVASIVEVIRPLEEAGVLVRRERDRLEQEIEYFLVAEIDGVLVGCCAIYPCEQQAELACVAVHPHYRGSGKASGLGGKLLDAAIEQARQQGAQQLFALTTQSQDWFLEQGFEASSPEALPTSRQSLYNWQRNSKVMIRTL